MTPAELYIICLDAAWRCYVGLPHTTEDIVERADAFYAAAKAAS